jgi:hypothetical protein
MTRPQKLFLTILTLLAVTILAALGCLALAFTQKRTAQPVSRPAAIQPATTPSPTLTATRAAPVTLTPTRPALPTPTSTRVVTQTTTPTPRPTPINCIHDIGDFEQSGVITNAEVEKFLRAAIPLSHLDHCLKIRYVPKARTMQENPVAGRFIPIIRWISVYPVTGVQLTPADILTTLIHEVGHNVYANMQGDNLPLADQWVRLHLEGPGFVSDYARTNELEDFAESYQNYVLAPGWLQQASPAKYEFMRAHVFNSYEYAR